MYFPLESSAPTRLGRSSKRTIDHMHPDELHLLTAHAKPAQCTQTWGRANLQKGDEVVLSVLEHHSNLVPWQLLAKERGTRLLHASDAEIAFTHALIPQDSKPLKISSLQNSTA